VRSKRIDYAREILQKELLPHVGVDEGCETKKVGGAACRTWH
jgi:DNA-directed RNA polymerase II subunit RPB2